MCLSSGKVDIHCGNIEPPFPTLGHLSVYKIGLYSSMEPLYLSGMDIFLRPIGFP